MPGRDPEARKRSARVAAEVRAVMQTKGLTGAALRALLEDKGFEVPNGMWVSRRVTGEVNLVKPVRVVYGPTDDLVKIAEVLGVDPNRLVRVVNQRTRTSSNPGGDQPAGDQPAA